MVTQSYVLIHGIRSRQIFLEDNMQIKIFLKALLSERAYIKDVVSRIELLNMTERDKLTIKSIIKCHICDQLFTDEIVKVSDHCHVSGIFRKESCQSYNLNFKHHVSFQSFVTG